MNKFGDAANFHSLINQENDFECMKNPSPTSFQRSDSLNSVIISFNCLLIHTAGSTATAHKSNLKNTGVGKKRFTVWIHKTMYSCRIYYCTTVNLLLLTLCIYNMDSTFLMDRYLWAHGCVTHFNFESIKTTTTLNYYKCLATSTFLDM